MHTMERLFSVFLFRPGPLLALGTFLALLPPLALKPWRSFHPLAFWPAWAQNVDDLRRPWHNLDLQREHLESQALQVA